MGIKCSNLFAGIMGVLFVEVGVVVLFVPADSFLDGVLTGPDCEVLRGLKLFDEVASGLNQLGRGRRVLVKPGYLVLLQRVKQRVVLEVALLPVRG